MQTHDIIVIGGGPAGSGFALATARTGKKVVILEKNPVPSHKVCGGVLSPRCLRAIDKIGLSDALKSIPANSLDHLEVELASGGSVKIPFPSAGPAALVVDRSALDAAFWKAAGNGGVELHEQTVARRIQPLDQGGWKVETQDAVFTAPMLAAADGRNSFVARQIGLAARGGGRSLCYQYRLKRHEFSLHGVHFFIFDGGYCGLSVDGTGLAHLDVISLRGGEQEDALKQRLFQQRSSFVERLERAEYCDDRPVTRSPIGSGNRPAPKRQDVILLGDAQFWVEPFTGEGISLALESANAATESIQLNKRPHAFRSRASHTNRWVARAIENPWLARFMVNLLQKAPSLARWMARDVLR